VKPGDLLFQLRQVGYELALRRAEAAAAEADLAAEDARRA
jgi:multidrug resistance efflux pump